MSVSSIIPDCTHSVPCSTIHLLFSLKNCFPPSRRPPQCCNSLWHSCTPDMVHLNEQFYSFSAYIETFTIIGVLTYWRSFSVDSGIIEFRHGPFCSCTIANSIALLHATHCHIMTPHTLVIFLEWEPYWLWVKLLSHSTNPLALLIFNSLEPWAPGALHSVWALIALVFRLTCYFSWISEKVCLLYCTRPTARQVPSHKHYYSTGMKVGRVKEHLHLHRNLSDFK